MYVAINILKKKKKLKLKLFITTLSEKMSKIIKFFILRHTLKELRHYKLNAMTNTQIRHIFIPKKI